MSKDYYGNILSIRAVEDAIRASKKYTEGIGTFRQHHPIQGTDEPTRNFCKYYEVYPSIPGEVSWDMDIIEAVRLLGNNYPAIDMRFDYDYRINRARVRIKAQNGLLSLLFKNIKGFQEAINNLAGRAA